MRWFQSMWGIGLCLGLAGCAGTQQRVAFGPGNLLGARTAAAHSHCGCGRAPQSPLPAAHPSPPVTALASRPPSPPALPSARFFPRLQEQDGAPVDPLENPRADWLGVRTVQGNQGGATPSVRDGATERTSTDERLPPVLPVVLKVAPPLDVPEGAEAQAPEVVSAEADSSSATQGLVPLQGGIPALGGEPAPRASPGAITLEYADEPVLAGRPRLASDGSVRPAPRSGGDPTRYGPDPTYPAAYYPEGSAPTSVPKNREVWPVSRPWRPTLLPRVWRRIREAVTGTDAPASSAVGEPHNIAEPGQGVERVVADRLDEPTER